MTIRSRNRTTFIFVVISVFLFFISLLTFLYAYLTENVELPEVYLKKISSTSILTFRPVCAYASIFFLQIYACITSYTIYRNFEKTQAPDLLFFLLFLTACLLDTSRLIFPLFHISTVYSDFLIKFSSLALLAKILAPLSLFGVAVLNTDELKQNTDRNCLIIIVTSLFFTTLIPLNSAVLLPNYCFSHGYEKTLTYLSIVVCVSSFISIHINCVKNEYNQIMTLGFGLICIGYLCLFECYNILHLISGCIFLSAGTILYLKEIHKHYLWLD